VDSAARVVRAVVGRLDLSFTAAGTRTVLAHAHVRAPLKIVRPFELEDGRVLVQVLHLGPGMCGGDEYAINISVQPRARAVVIMQAAARVIGMRDGAHASQQVTLNVEPGGHLEYYPGLTIPFADGSFVQRVDVNAARDSRLGILETWGTGRNMRGEHLAFRRISSRTRVSIDGQISFADAMELEPAATDVGGTGVLEGHRYVASGFWHNATLDRDAGLTVREGVIAAFGQSTLDSVYLRTLAMDGGAVMETTNESVRIVNAAWNLPPIPLRRFTS
jgi:urease accessory protein